jgi:hypothetical protein
MKMTRRGLEGVRTKREKLTHLVKKEPDQEGSVSHPGVFCLFF